MPKDEHIANITLPTDDVYQFAVSANAIDRSSGMIWATCTILHNKGKFNSDDSLQKVHLEFDQHDQLEAWW